ncbi:hypothetical protein B0H16DRAFT_352210 [Mycena metata]|uniref:Uncharacterized protein n=1 Tax=Mycena metata TaxID=1033252 RepID=A0AAD7NLS3_9AGAR|nr:hypothetical protein B0H16DRAFT_352210 [Mycena metata]
MLTAYAAFSPPITMDFFQQLPFLMFPASASALLLQNCQWAECGAPKRTQAMLSGVIGRTSNTQVEFHGFGLVPTHARVRTAILLCNPDRARPDSNLNPQKSKFSN